MWYVSLFSKFARMLHCVLPWASYLHALSTLIQEAAFSTAGVDFSDTSAFTQDQWPIICSQLKPVLRQKDAADSAKNCSSRLGNMYEAAQTMCPIAGAASNNPANNANDAVSKAMRTAMCQGFKAMVSLDSTWTAWQNVVNAPVLDQV